MIRIQDSVVFKDLLEHISQQRLRAKLTDKSFELGIATDVRPSQILQLVKQDENMKTLQEFGMANYQWRNDALRSELKLAGENLLISICEPR